MTEAEFLEIAERVERVARSRVGTGNDEQDAVLHYDALLLARSVSMTLNNTAALQIILAGAKVQKPSEDVCVHARQVVESLWEAKTSVDAMSAALVRMNQESQRDVAGMREANETLRRKLHAAEEREHQLRLELEKAAKKGAKKT